MKAIITILIACLLLTGVSSQGNFDGIIQTVRGYYDDNVAAGRTGHNWLQVLIAFGAETHDTLTPMTAADARERVSRWQGWKPVADALEQLEAQSAPPTEPPPPTNMPLPTNTPMPTNTPAPSSTPMPTNTPAPSSTPMPTNTLAPSSTPMPTNTPAPSSTPMPTNTPAPSNTPMPTNTPIPPTSTPTSSPTPLPTANAISHSAQLEPQPLPLNAEPQQAPPTLPDPQKSENPTWVDGTNCFWWDPPADTNRDIWKVRTFDTFQEWRDNRGNNINWALPPVGEGRHVVDISGARPTVVEFRYEINGVPVAGRIVSLFISMGMSHSIKDYMNAYGLRPPEPNTSFPNDDTACSNASRYFTVFGNIIPEHIYAVSPTYPTPTHTPTP